MIMKFSGITARRRIAGVAAGALLGGVAAATIAAPNAAAAPGLHGRRGVQHRQHDAWLRAGLSRTLTRAPTRPSARRSASRVDQAAGTLRGYFTANPQEYYDLKGILAPIGDTQRQCNVSVLPPELASAYTEFMAG